MHTIGELFITVDVIEKYRDVLQLDVFPNPIADHAYIQIKGYENNDTEMHLFNSVGQKMNIMFFENGKVKVNSALSSGVYFFQIFEKGNLLGAGKLVIK